jgi:hypothetical protein
MQTILDFYPGKIKVDCLPGPTRGCWVWQRARNRGGYGILKRDGKSGLAHRFSWETSIGPITDKVLHKCDNPACVNPSHLFEGSQCDNNKDKKNKGRGAKAQFSKRTLTADQVRAIRANPLGLSGVELAKLHGTSPLIISRIRALKIYTVLEN